MSNLGPFAAVDVAAVDAPHRDGREGPLVMMATWLLILLAAWFVLIVLVLALCWAADMGDSWLDIDPSDCPPKGTE